MSDVAPAAVTVFRASEVVTVSSGRVGGNAPTGIAVRDGRIVDVGVVDELLDTFFGATVDETFAESVLLPGFVEAHSHATEGALWAWEYVGYFPRLGPDGIVRAGCQTFEQLLEVLKRLDAELSTTTAPDEPLMVWGFDPIYFEGERLAAWHLDLVSLTRPVTVIHASLHLLTVNTALMEREGVADGSPVAGVPVGSDGRPIGELQEQPAMSLAKREMAAVFGALASSASVGRLGDMARLVGCTTVTELGAGRLSERDVDRWLAVADRPDFPARLSVFYNPSYGPASVADQVGEVLARAANSTERVRFGNVKIIVDGSIQGFTARLNPPGYLANVDGTPRPNGIWLITPERLHELVDAFHRAHITVHTHVNGDQATDLLLDAVEAATAAHQWDDHRHTAQHSQLTSAAQYARMAALGMNANLFSNHLFYWGDQHRDVTVGAERAARMNACATADAAGVRYSVHSDASVTPLGSLHTMWCAVNRVTATGTVLGPGERITAERALRAVTVDAAHQLRLDDEIGSIEVGKRADFVALAENPLHVDPMGIRDIAVHGTVLDGAATA